VHVATGSGSSSDDVSDVRRSYCRLVAGLLRDMGVVKGQLGEMAAGCQLLCESACLYQWLPNSEELELSTDDVIRVAEVFAILHHHHHIDIYIYTSLFTVNGSKSRKK